MKIELIVPNSLNEITLGQYQKYLKLGELTETELSYKMIVLYRPIELRKGSRYHIKEYEGGDADHLKDMPLDAVLGSILFFYHLGSELCQVTMNSLTEVEDKNLLEFLNSETSGDGILAFTHSLNKILGDLKISLN
jgi:hypothetical protein